MFFLAGGCIIAYFKLRADKSKDLEIIVWYHRELVLADWLFTLPSSLLLLFSGLGLVHLYGLPLTTSWLLIGLAGYAIAGCCWIPAVYFQFKMRNLAIESLANGANTPSAAYYQAKKWWLVLGVPAFVSAGVALWAMIFKSL